MQPVNIFMLAIGILWCLFTLFGIGMLFPGPGRRLWEWQIKRKGGHVKLVAPSRLQLVVFILLSSLMVAVAMSAAFHRDLLATIGINSGTASHLMIILPALYFTLGWLKKPRKGGQQPDA
jgi:hypothetical protein